MALIKFLLFTLIDFADSHGIMVWPVPRQGGTPLELGGNEGQGRKNARYNFGRDGQGARYQSKGTPGKDYTLVGSVDELLAVTVSNKKAPWKAPGTAMPYHACGRQGRKAKNKHGLDYDLDPSNMVTWKRGTSQQVAWTAFHNHQGGYAYRLLKVPSNPQDVTELDFQAQTLEFDGNTSVVRTTEGEEIEIPAARGFFTANEIRQHWTSNPIPENRNRPYGLPDGVSDENFYAPNRKNQGHRYWNWKFSLVDKVKIPKDLEPGHYYINWRWDAGSETQMWTNCGDVNIVAKGDSTPLPEGGASWGEEDEEEEPEPEPEEEEPEPEPESDDDSKKGGGSGNRKRKNRRKRKRKSLLQPHAESGKAGDSEPDDASVSESGPGTDDESALKPESEVGGKKGGSGGKRRRKRKGGGKKGGGKKGGSGGKRRRKKKTGGSGKKAAGLLQTVARSERPVLKGGKLVHAQVSADGEISLE